MTKIATSFVAILSTAAFLQSVVLPVEAGYNQGGQGFGSSIQFDTCACVTSDFAVNQDDNNRCNPDENMSGSQARTWQNLCGGSRGNNGSFDDDFTNSNSQASDNDNGDQDFFSIPQRVGDPFRDLCRLIGQYPNVRELLGRGISPHTIFAPTDSAFTKVSGVIGALDEQKLLEIHILPQARLTYDLTCGQTYRTLNTDNNRNNVQRIKTKCVTAANTQVLGPGNYKTGQKPTIGVPNNVFNANEFENQFQFAITVQDELSDSDNAGDFNLLFSQDVISCNGVIHVVDNVILPGNSQPQNAYNGRNYYGSTYRSGGGYYGGNSGGTTRSHYYGSGNQYYGGGKGTSYYSGGKGTSYYSGGKGTSYYSGSGKGSGGYYHRGGKGSKGGKGGKGSKHGGYYGNKGGKGRKGSNRGYGKGTGQYGKGSSYGNSGGYYSGSSYGGGYGGGYYNPGGGYYRRDLESEQEEGDYQEGNFGEYEAEYADFLDPDFEDPNRELYGSEENEVEDKETEQQVAGAAAAREASIAEKFKGRKRRLEALLEPNGNIAQVEA